MIVARDLEHEQATDQLVLAIVGEQKSGKSTLAATARPEILVLDYDLRAPSIAGKKGVWALSMVDPPHPAPQTVIPATFDILSSLERSRKLRDISYQDTVNDVIQTIKPFASADQSKEVKTIVLDSAISMAKASLNFVLASSADIRFAINIGGKFTSYSPKSYIGWNADSAQAESIILRCIATGLDTIMTFHESKEEAPDSTEEAPKWTGKLTVFPVRYARLLKNFSEVWRLTLKPGGPGGRYVPQVRVCQDWDFNSATCMLGLNLVEEPDIQKMLAKHQIALKAQPKV